MREETIFEFLINEDDKEYDCEVLINLNYFKNCATSNQLIQEVELLGKKVCNLNIHNISNQNTTGTVLFVSENKSRTRGLFV